MNSVNTMLTISDFALKEGDFETFQVQLMQDDEPFRILPSMTVRLRLANKISIIRFEEVEIIDADKGIIGFGIFEAMPSGIYDCEFVVTDLDLHQTFPEKGYQSITVTPSLQGRIGGMTPITPDQYELLLNQIMEVESKIVENTFDETKYMTKEELNVEFDGKSDKGHTHNEYLTEHQDISHLATISEVRNKSDIGHKHDVEEIENLRGILDEIDLSEYAKVEHTHNIEEIEDFEHTHVIDEIIAKNLLDIKHPENIYDIGYDWDECKVDPNDDDNYYSVSHTIEVKPNECYKLHVGEGDGWIYLAVFDENGVVIPEYDGRHSSYDGYDTIVRMPKNAKTSHIVFEAFSEEVYKDAFFGEATIKENLDNKIDKFRLYKNSIIIADENANLVSHTKVNINELNTLDKIDTTKTIQEQIDSKQNTLVSGVNVKTINGTSILGTGNIIVESGGIKDEDLIEYAKKTEIPTKVSDLTNDSGFVTNNDMTTKLSATKTELLSNIQNIKVGGRNFLLNSGRTWETSKGSAYQNSYKHSPISIVTQCRNGKYDYLNGKEMTFSFDVYAIGEYETIGTSQVELRFGMHTAFYWANENYTAESITYPHAQHLNTQGQSGRVSQTSTIKAPSGYPHLIDISIAIQCHSRPLADGVTWYLANPKLEEGNKATDWTPAIEDMAEKSEIPTKLSELENDKGFLTEIPSEYVTEDELEEALENMSGGDEIPEHTHTPEEILTEGNLFNPNTTTVGYITSSGSFTNSSSYFITDYIAVKPNFTYKWYHSSSGDTYATYTADKTLIKVQYGGNTLNSEGYTALTFGSNVAYVRLDDSTSNKGKFQFIGEVKLVDMLLTSKTFNATIPTSGWSTSGVSGDTTCSISINITGLTSNDIPHICPVYGSNFETNLGIQKAWNMISRAVAYTDTLMVYSFTGIPETSIPILIEVIRQGG